MRYANPNFIQALLNRMEKAIAHIKDEQFERDALRVQKGYDQAEKEYFQEKYEQSKVDDFMEDLENAYTAEHTKEDEIANLLAWIDQREKVPEQYKDIDLGGDHVYPLPVQLF